MMKIYTKGGDKGETGLYGGARVLKDHLRIEAYGTLDEANAVIGIACSVMNAADPLRARLAEIQAELFQLGAELATPQGKTSGMALIDDGQITALEQEIDRMEAKLSPLKNFILPGGTQASAYLHLARTVVRRAERKLVTLNRDEPVRDVTIRYVNRLSDYLFVCARFVNYESNTDDVPWIAPKTRG